MAMLAPRPTFPSMGGPSGLKTVAVQSRPLPSHGGHWGVDGYSDRQDPRRLQYEATPWKLPPVKRMDDVAPLAGGGPNEGHGIECNIAADVGTEHPPDSLLYLTHYGLFRVHPEALFSFL